MLELRVVSLNLSPCCRFVELSLCIVHNWRELAGSHIGLANAFHERGLSFENSTVMLLGVEYANWEIQDSAHYSHRFDQIRIIRN